MGVPRSVTLRRAVAPTIFVAVVLTTGPRLSPGHLGPLLTVRREAAVIQRGTPARVRFPQAWRGAVRAGVPPLVSGPRKTKHVDPVYPEGARQERIEGEVVLDLLVDEGGAVEDVRVLRSVGLLDHAAVDAVRQWRFTPSLLEDKPIKVILTANLTFAIRE